MPAYRRGGESDSETIQSSSDCRSIQSTKAAKSQAKVQRAFTKKLPDMNSLTYRERLSVLRLESLELRRLKADLIVF